MSQWRTLDRGSQYLRPSFEHTDPDTYRKGIFMRPNPNRLKELPPEQKRIAADCVRARATPDPGARGVWFLNGLYEDLATATAALEQVCKTYGLVPLSYLDEWDKEQEHDQRLLRRNMTMNPMYRPEPEKPSNPIADRVRDQARKMLWKDSDE